MSILQIATGLRNNGRHAWPTSLRPLTPYCDPPPQGVAALRAAAERPLESTLTNRSATVQRSSAARAADCYRHTVPGARNT
jgi:hypothetical protein